MGQTAVSIRAHFDGKVIVPDDPLYLPTNAALDVVVKPRTVEDVPDASTIALRLSALEQFVSRGTRGSAIPDPQLRREELYGDDGR